VKYFLGFFIKNKILIIAEINPATIQAIDVKRLNVVTIVTHSKIDSNYSI